MNKLGSALPLPGRGWNLLIVPSPTLLSPIFCSVNSLGSRLQGWGFSLPIALPDGKFHALRISCQGALEAELARATRQGAWREGGVGGRPGVDLGSGVSWSESTQSYLSDTHGAYHMQGPVLSPLQASVHLQEAQRGRVSSPRTHSNWKSNAESLAPESSPLPESGLKEARQTLPLKSPKCPWGQRCPFWSGR